MKNNGTPEDFHRQYRFKRGPDRRHFSEMVPPPYITGEGLVLVDRRSHIDRRSSWIKDFFIRSEH